MRRASPVPPLRWRKIDIVDPRDQGRAAAIARRHVARQGLGQSSGKLLLHPRGGRIADPGSQSARRRPRCRGYLMPGFSVRASNGDGRGKGESPESGKRGSAGHGDGRHSVPSLPNAAPRRPFQSRWKWRSTAPPLLEPQLPRRPAGEGLRQRRHAPVIGSLDQSLINRHRIIRGDRPERRIWRRRRRAVPGPGGRP